MDELEFAAQFRPAGPVTVQDVLTRQLALPDRRELEQDAADREAAAARAERDETRAMLNATRGDPLGQLSRAQAVVASCRDEVSDLEAQLEVARGRLHRAAESLVDWQDQADEILSVSAQRSRTPDMLAEAKQVAAGLRVDAMLAARSQAPRRAPRPFAGRGSVTRSEYCGYCIADGVSDEDSYLLHSDPELNCPVTPPEQMAKAERAHRGGREVSR
jgi:hypothetical protein